MNVGKNFLEACFVNPKKRVYSFQKKSHHVLPEYYLPTKTIYALKTKPTHGGKNEFHMQQNSSQ